RASDDPDPVSTYLAEREKRRAAYEADRLLYVAVTRACQQLHLIGEVALDDEGGIKEPSASSLLGRLWPHMRQPEPPPLAEVLAGQNVQPPRSTPRPLLRVTADRLSQPSAPVGASEPASVWQWASDTTHEAAIGTVAHAWLERLGRQGLDAWSEPRIHEHLPVIRKQLGRAGLPVSALDAAAQVVSHTLCATLASEKGRWLLNTAKAQRAWSLLEVNAQQLCSFLDTPVRASMTDIAIVDEERSLVVDDETSMPPATEDSEQFAARMRLLHVEQWHRDCLQVAALDGRPARAALYFP